MRILAVDDDDEFLELLQFHFERAGIDVVTCTSGKRALELLEVHRFEVIMVDLVMPVMGGRSLARNIRKRPRHADLPIVMMTHMNNVPLIDIAHAGDANHFINKGGELGSVVQLVSQLSGRRASPAGA